MIVSLMIIKEHTKTIGVLEIESVIEGNRMIRFIWEKSAMKEASSLLIIKVVLVINQ
jgi:hypothetical protein